LPLLRYDVLLASRLSLPEARSRLVAALRPPCDGADPPLCGVLEGWSFDVVLSGLDGGLRAVGARGRLVEEAGDTLVELVLRPARGVRRLLGAGLVGIAGVSVTTALLSVAAVAQGYLPIWVAALGWILPVAGGSGWLLLLDVFFQRGAEETLRYLTLHLEAEVRP
jgi:hypothetical protein